MARNLETLVCSCPWDRDTWPRDFVFVALPPQSHVHDVAASAPRHAPVLWRCNCPLSSCSSMHVGAASVK
jgi:hypothetical protein